MEANIEKGTKICSRCGQEKPLDQFYTSSATKDGYRPQCIECSKLTKEPKYPAREIIAIRNDAYYFDESVYLPFSRQDEWELVEQKPADKVEPKFHEGDWIITNKNHIWYVDETPETTSYLYRLINQYGKVEVAEFEIVDKKARLWTIQDAKDGDVLVNWNNTAFIFKAIEDETVKFHIAYNEKWDAIKTPSTKSSHLGLPEPQFEFHPATKEQRDLLFKKMYEAGYEWDADKKELKKIEDEIEIPFGAKDSELIEESYYIPKGFHAEIDDDKVVIKKGEKSAAWSEEDKDFMYDTLSNLTELKDRYGEGYGNVGKCIDWLKSIKDRYAWKPSDEQMEALANALSLAKNCGEESSYDLRTLYEQLKKLREE